MAKLSVVVPVYGVELYLEKCVESLINQTLSDIEIILVDDGSKDRCPEMCDEFAKRDARIKVIHKPNGGLSDARNVGVQHATTEYIIFIDSDDYAETNMCEFLYNAIIEHKVDMVCALVNEIRNGQLVGEQLSFPSKKMSRQEALFSLFSGRGITMYACAKIYRKSLFDKVQYPKGKIYEDAFTTPYLINQCDNIYVTSKRVYNYIRRNESITLTKYSTRDLHCIEAHTKNLKFVKDKYPNLIESAEFRYYWSLLYVYDKMLINNVENTEEAKSLWTKIKANKNDMFKNSYLSKNRKMALVLMLMSKKLYLKVLKRME